MQFYTDEKKKVRPLSNRKSRFKKRKRIIARSLFKPVTPGKTWTPAYKHIRRDKDVLKTLMEKIPLISPLIGQLDEIRRQALKGKGSLAARRVRAQKLMLRKIVRVMNVCCYLCGKRVTETEALTTHHINHNHSDNRPRNKAVSHERCHRQYHYEDIKPRNPKTKGIFRSKLKKRD